jgi:5'-nucleotidase / UDP-sugar diphosphatase
VQAGAFGSDLGRLDLEIVNGRIESYQRQLIVLDHDVLTPDPTAEVWLNEQIAPYRKQMDEVVGNASSWLIRAQALAGQRSRKRDEESPVDSLFADLLREAFEADVAFLPGVGYGIAIPPGEISAAQLRQLIPHDGKVVTLSLSGLQVREVLEQSLDNIYSENPAINVGGMIQISGIRLRYIANAAKGARVVDLQKLDGTWNDLDRLKIVTNSMLSDGGHNQETFRNGIDRREHKSQYEHIKELIRSEASLQTPALGRISAR